MNTSDVNQVQTDTGNGPDIEDQVRCGALRTHKYEDVWPINRREIIQDVAREASAGMWANPIQGEPSKQDALTQRVGGAQIRKQKGRKIGPTDGSEGPNAEQHGFEKTHPIGGSTRRRKPGRKAHLAEKRIRASRRSKAKPCEQSKRRNGLSRAGLSTS